MYRFHIRRNKAPSAAPVKPDLLILEEVVVEESEHTSDSEINETVRVEYPDSNSEAEASSGLRRPRYEETIEVSLRDRTVLLLLTGW